MRHCACIILLDEVFDAFVVDLLLLVGRSDRLGGFRLLSQTGLRCHQEQRQQECANRRDISSSFHAFIGFGTRRLLS